MHHSSWSSQHSFCGNEEPIRRTQAWVQRIAKEPVFLTSRCCPTTFASAGQSNKPYPSLSISACVSWTPLFRPGALWERVGGRGGKPPDRGGGGTHTHATP